jgi:hypothetical protein
MHGSSDGGLIAFVSFVSGPPCSVLLFLVVSFFVGVGGVLQAEKLAT